MFIFVGHFICSDSLLRNKDGGDSKKVLKIVYLLSACIKTVNNFYFSIFRAITNFQVIKSSSTSRVPDCFQRTPKRVQISENGGQILTIAVDGQGIHAIIRNGQKLSYVVYNISTGRIEQDNQFPSDTAAFMGLHPTMISLFCAGEVNNSSFIERSIIENSPFLELRVCTNST